MRKTTLPDLIASTLLMVVLSAPSACLSAEIVLLSASVPDSIARFDGLSGIELPPLVPSGSTNLGEPNGVLIGPDGNLYVSSGQTDEVFRFDPVSGAFLGVFASGGGLDRPWDLAFGPDGNFYVSSFRNHRVPKD